jgi:hypothetical protein
MTEERNDEQAVRDETEDMAHTADDMDERLDDLGDDIEDARRTAERRQDAPDEELIAGDWEDASAGAHQGAGPAEVVKPDDED